MNCMAVFRFTLTGCHQHCYLVFNQSILVEPNVTQWLHLRRHHHSSRFQLLHATLDGQEVTSLCVLDTEKVALL